METAQQVMRNLVSALIAATCSLPSLSPCFMISQHKFNLICARDSIPGLGTLCYCIQRRRLAWTFAIIGCEIYRLSPNGEFFCLITMHSKVSRKVIGKFWWISLVRRRNASSDHFLFPFKSNQGWITYENAFAPLFRGCQKVFCGKVTRKGNRRKWMGMNGVIVAWFCSFGINLCLQTLFLSSPLLADQ